MIALTKKRSPKPTKVFDTYWKFATERQAIFFRRLKGETPWTKDPVLVRNKFTNAYRASDRVSQYLIKKVIYSGKHSAKDTFFRILLFKTFNKIETWEFLSEHLGEIKFKNYSFDKYDNILGELARNGKTIYSGAYIMASGRSTFGFKRKYQNHLKLIESMMKDGLFHKIEKAKTMEEVFELLLWYPTIGSFLAYQYSIDINYSELTNFNEMDFVVPGPGAISGLSKCFSDMGDYTGDDCIRYMTDIQENEFERLGLKFHKLWGRRLQLIDCQNLFCEVDKYSRVYHPKITGSSERKRIKQLFKPKSASIDYWFPPKWGINNKIEKNEQREKRIYKSLQ